ncbi:MAG: mechanosensitive ion channel [Akkermansiaceae bacterium]|nr:mechanosensitive ion channel [Akkermansiaceae bacterium]
MNFHPKTSHCLRWISVIYLGFSGFTLSHAAPVSPLKSALAAQNSAPTTAADTPEIIRARITQWIQEANDALAKIDASAAEPILPSGVSSAELDDHRRELEATVMNATQWLKSIDATDGLRKASESARAEREAWTGFKEAPPYSILMLDALLNERDATQSRLDANQAILLNCEQLAQTIMDQARAAEETVTQRVTEFKKPDPEKIDTAKWRLDAARAQSRQLATRSGLLESKTRALKDEIENAKAELSLLARKVKITKAKAHFSDEDFAKVVKIADDRMRVSKHEADAISKRLSAAKNPLAKAQAALDALVTATPAVDANALELAKFRLEVAQGRVDSLQSMSERVERLPQLEKLTLDAYQSRRILINTTQPQRRSDALKALEQFDNRIQVSENSLEQDISKSHSDLIGLESRAASVSPGDPRFELLSEKRATQSEMLAILERISQTLETRQQLIKRWISEYSLTDTPAGILTHIGKFTTATQGVIQKIWSFGLMTFEDHLVVDGQTLTRTIPVTLGMLLRALLFFVIAYAVFSKIANRIQQSLITRGHVADAQARTLRNWLMMAVGVLLAIGTLSFLKIPLTVFAFFGGALAIGLGFGTQTLIKNFISGIIVLVERKVRVGDVLDVDGIVGTVTEINTRSSIIHSAEDVETIIPNSLFLENRVTNWTLSNSRSRRNLRIFVAYGTAPEKMIQILMETAVQYPSILKHPKPFATFEEFGERSMIFCLYFWLELDAANNATIVTSDLRILLSNRFSEEGIQTYPQPLPTP